MKRALLSVLVLFAASASAEDVQPVEPVSPADLKTMTVNYTVQFDPDETGDKVCESTGICDCETTYKGAGALVEATKTSVTFQGSWEIVEDSCKTAETLLWTARSGKAFHTVKFSEDGKVTAWIAHGKKKNTEPLKENIKAGQQAYVTELARPLDPNTLSMIHAESETEWVYAFNLKTVHNLVIQFGKE